MLPHPKILLLTCKPQQSKASNSPLLSVSPLLPSFNQALSPSPKNLPHSNKLTGALLNAMSTVGCMATASKRTTTAKHATTARTDTKKMQHATTTWAAHKIAKGGAPDGACQQGQIAHLN